MAKIALYHPWLKGKGGAEKVVLEYARNSEHEVEVFTLFYNEERTFSEFQEINIQVLGSNKEPGSFIDKGLRFGLGAIITKLPLQKFDKLIVSEAGLGSLITLRNHEIPVICYCHTPLRPTLPEFRKTYRKEKNIALRPIYFTGIELYNFLEKQAWKKFDKVITNSQLTKRRVMQKKLASEDKIKIVNPGSDIESNKSESYQNYFFYPSRFRRYKRQDLAIKAFQKADLDNFKLILAGGGQEREYIEELQEMSDENTEIKTDVPSEEWSKLYANSYTVLFCAENEDWGIIPVEAASYSKPVISVDEGGPQESIKEGETGYLVEPQPEKLAEKMEQLAKQPEKAKKIGQNAKEHSKKYSWKKFTEKIDQTVK